ncbi:Uu.00g110040.m01.CDS01 [Anthostomella pinea]|uniref:Uu.00g110040.m01.CDS01 n=1 Tax=Anthostomella pinea TaxID=933095 RepID=A0AAI8VFI1_9PEZI|nr:Uu.00g110040.m01.CDS01 [Anthostomella pinea]
MGDFKARIKAKFLRRSSSTATSLASSKHSLGRDGASSSTRPLSPFLGSVASDEHIHSDNVAGHNFKGHRSHDSVASSKSKARRADKFDRDSIDGAGVGGSGTRDGQAESRAITGQGHGQGQGLEGHGRAHAGEPSLVVAPSPSAPRASLSRAVTTPLLIAANSDVGESPTTTTTQPTTLQLKLGNDLQKFALNSSTAPVVTTPGGAALPSIHEHPATSSTRAGPIDDDTLSVLSPYSPDILTPPATTTTPAGLTLLPPSSSSPARPLAPLRRQSILPDRQTTLIKALLDPDGNASEIVHAEPDQLLPISGTMVTRKIWVKRPLASATLVTINEEDLVDDVREMILRKYANSLGRQFDAPDLTLRICNREQQSSRTLQPDEPMGRTLDAYYPGGQSVDDALLIDIPSRRTPKASPNPRYIGEDRPHESGTDYFPPFPAAPHTHHTVSTGTAALNGSHTIHFPPSMAILGGGQLPLLPSPGGTRRLGQSRPKIQRLHTASPASTVTNAHSHSTQSVPPVPGTHNYSKPHPRSRTHSAASSDQPSHPPAAPPAPTPPPVERTATPPPQLASPRPSARAKKNKKIDHPSLPPGMLDGAVPPINVLIVEDNIINLKLLEAFVKRLKVRWQTAMNGREAVNKWRAGGFHLVLMDIQLPVMNGLDATREIRRIEKVNSIGVFSSSASSPPEEIQADPSEEDKLANTEMFKSPVIIVALTASSLQSDRQEALAAGCNDFLTKPVNFVWLERKVKEWGCMQALIDFDGWRKWKDFSQKSDDASKKAAVTAKAKPAKNKRLSLTTAAA